MKIFYLILSILFICSCGYSPPINQQTQTAGHSGKNSVTVSCDEEGICRLTINGRRVEAEFYHMGGSEPFIERLKGSSEDIFLMTLSHGDGCPAMFRLIHLISKDQFYVSEAFGNCNGTKNILFENNEIKFEFPALEEAGREKAVYWYSYENNKLTEIK